MESRGNAWAVAMALTGLVLATSALAQDQRGWLGISVRCVEPCTQEERGGAVVFSFSSAPWVDLVREGGPAARAGLEVGDRIIAIDGVDITTAEGGRLFGAMRTGVPTELRVLRDGLERTITVTPGSEEESLGEWTAYVRPGGQWDSMRVQLNQLFKNQLELQVALREAENALARVELRRAAETREAERSQTAERLRIQVDSITRALASSRKLLRLQADSLAVRALRPRPPVMQYEFVVPSSPETRSIVVYSDAVAGARFEELSEGSHWLDVLPGVSEGLLIIKVVEDTPAHRAGLREGDVVLAMNGEPVRSVSQLRKLLRNAERAELTYVRKGKKQTCTIPSR